jgi:peptidoglycan/LPS O-acetylase OafA/YrhL
VIETQTLAARCRRLALAGLWAVLTYSTPALAHARHGSEEDPTGVSALPLGLFVVGVLVAGTSVYLDEVGDVPRKAADAGVFAGIALVAVAATAFLWGHSL